VGRVLIPILAVALGCTAAKKDSRQAEESGQPTGDSGQDTATAPGTNDLVHLDAWEPLAASEDPYPGHQPELVDCAEDAWHEEDGLLEIETGQCSYLNLTQPSRIGVAAGDSIELLVYHSALSSTDEPAQAHLAVLLDGRPILDQTIPIPSSSQIYDRTVLQDAATPAGAQVVIHLHNHGGNSWKLGHLRAVRD